MATENKDLDVIGLLLFISLALIIITAVISLFEIISDCFVCFVEAMGHFFSSVLPFWLGSQPQPSPPGTAIQLSVVAVVPNTPLYVYQKEEAAQGVEYCCAICLDALEDQVAFRVLPHCGHRFHQACINAWFLIRKNCPVCRSELKEPIPYLADGL